MVGFIIWAIVVAGTLTAGAYAIDSGNTATHKPIQRHRKGHHS